MTAAPEKGSATLVLADSDAAGQAAITPETPLLGLPMARRAALAAARAGFERVYFLAGETRVRPAVLEGTRARPFPFEAPASAIPAGRVVLLSDQAFAEPRWLRTLRELPAEPERLHRLGAGAVVHTRDPGPLAAALSRDSRLASVVADWARILPPGESELGAAPARDVTTELELADAERRLLRSLVKKEDGFLARHVNRRISLAVSRRLAATGVTPNTMTAVSAALGLAGAAFFLSTAVPNQIAGAILFLLHSVLDGCDGELARLKFQESRRGAVLDFWGDNAVHVAVFSAIAVAWSSASGEPWPLLLGALAVSGTLLSAGFVYMKAMRPKADEGPLLTSVSPDGGSLVSEVADFLARRDFIYLALVLAVVGKIHWFLVLAAAGAPIFFLVLLAMAFGHRQIQSAPAAEPSPGRNGGGAR